jgi:hypothetical protein
MVTYLVTRHSVGQMLSPLLLQQMADIFTTVLQKDPERNNKYGKQNSGGRDISLKIRYG